MTTPAQVRFEHLVRVAGPRVLAYLARRTLPREDSADVHQRVLLTTWRRIDDAPSGDDDATAWMIAVARRELANHRRGEVRRSEATQRLRAELARPTSGTQPELSDQAEHLTELLAGLDELDRQIVTLTYWEQLTSEQIGIVVGLSAASVRKRLQRTRQALAAQVGAGCSPVR